jgi:hypothetical protein
MATVTAPAPDFTGTRAGVSFRDGRGEVDADNVAALAYFARHGYAIEPHSTPTKKEARGRAAVPADDVASTSRTEGEPSHA